MKRATIVVFVGFLMGLVVGSVVAGETASPYPPGCDPPVAFVSFTLSEGGSGVATAEQALPVEVQDEVGDAEPTVEGDLEFETPEGETFVITEVGGGYALERMRVCGGEVGQGAVA